MTPAKALNELVGAGGWVTPAPGQYWVAGGMEESAQELAKAAETIMMSGIGYLQKETPGNP